MSYAVTEPVKVNWLIFYFHYISVLFKKKMLLCGILEAFSVHDVSAFLWCVILDDGRLHRSVCGICSVQSSSLRCVRYLCNANKRSSRLMYHWSTVQLFEMQISDFFLFFSPHLPRWWGGQLLSLTCWDPHQGECFVFTGGSSFPLTICVLFQHVPAAGCLLEPVLLAPVPESDQTHTRTQFPVELRNCWPSFQRWLLFPVQLLVCESSGAWSWEGACLGRGGRKRQV